MTENTDCPRFELLTGEVCAFSGAWRKAVPCFIITDESSGQYGKATLTNYRLVVQPDNDTFFAAHRLRGEMFDFPVYLIEKIAKSETRSEIGLELWGKDGRYLKLRFNQAINAEHNIIKALAALAFPLVPKLRFCFCHKYTGRIDGWSLYSPIKEYDRLGVNVTTAHLWQIVDNQDGQVCSTYPPFFVLPAGLSREAILACANFRKRNRMPALVWVDSNTNASLWRASQPKVGISTKSIGDELVISLINQGTPSTNLLILDCRPYLNAQANRTKGGGYERENHYPNVELKFLNIENIHKVREAYKAVLFQSNTVHASKYLSTVERSGWLDHISSILAGSVLCLNSLIAGQSVLVHCSDGWDRTSQVCSITQFCIDPYFRTLRGFCELIEKDWLSYGHQFELRLGHASSNVHDKRSPIFLQFLDCILQISRQFPSYLEFNERLLLDLVSFSQNCRFGTFMFNSYQERMESGLSISSSSVWTYVLDRPDLYTNPYYREGTEDTIFPSSSIRKLVIWQEYFHRWHTDFYFDVTAFNSQRELQETLMKCAQDGLELYKEDIRSKISRIEELEAEVEMLKGQLQESRRTGEFN